MLKPNIFLWKIVMIIKPLRICVLSLAYAWTRLVISPKIDPGHILKFEKRAASKKNPTWFSIIYPFFSRVFCYQEERSVRDRKAFSYHPFSAQRWRRTHPKGKFSTFTEKKHRRSWWFIYFQRLNPAIVKTLP